MDWEEKGEGGREAGRYACSKEEGGEDGVSPGRRKTNTFRTDEETDGQRRGTNDRRGRWITTGVFCV